MCKNGNVGLIRRYANDLTLKMAVNVKPWHSLVLMSTVALSNVIPCDLCIVKSHAIRSGIYWHAPLVIGEMGTYGGCEISHGVAL